MDFGKTWNATEIFFYSDASKNAKLGFSAVCERSWMAEVWPEGFIKEYDPSIEYLEIFAVAAAVMTWIHRFRNRRIVLFCDNQSVAVYENPKNYYSSGYDR